MALSSSMLRCRPRLLPSGSRDRICRLWTLIFIMAVRGAHVFAPYQRLSCRAAGSPSPGQPARPLLRDDPDHVWQVAAALATALLDGQEPKPGGFPNGILNHPATDPSPGRDFIHAAITVTVLANLVTDDPQDRQFADRELA